VNNKHIKLNYIKFSKGIESKNLIDESTLAIPTYNRPHKIQSILEGILKVTKLPSVILIIDGGSEHNTLKEITKFSKIIEHPFDIYWVKSPKGLTIQRNVALDICTTKYLYFFDDDCIPCEHYFIEVYNSFKKYGNEIGAVNSVIINEISPKLSLKNKIRKLVRITNNEMQPNIYYPHGSSVSARQRPHYDQFIDTISGGACAWDVDKLREIGGFSEFFEGYAQGEDLESALRMRRKYKIIWSSQAHCLHLHDESGRPDLFLKGKMEVYNRYYIWKNLTSNVELISIIKFWTDVALINVLYSLLLLIKNNFEFKYIKLILGYIYGTILSLFSRQKFLTHRNQFYTLNISKIE
jgi:glycosyltransferase involved in cell wall biosynthesis